MPNSLRLTEIDNWADFADFQLLASIISAQLCRFRGSAFPKLTKISLTCKYFEIFLWNFAELLDSFLFDCSKDENKMRIDKW